MAASPILHLKKALYVSGRIQIKSHGVSMPDSFPQGSTALLEEKDSAHLQAGDLVAFEWRGRAVVHRLITTDPHRVCVRGEGKDATEEWVETIKVLGVVKSVRKPPQSFGRKIWQKIKS